MRYAAQFSHFLNLLHLSEAILVNPLKVAFRGRFVKKSMDFQGFSAFLYAFVKNPGISMVFSAFLYIFVKNPGFFALS